MGIEVGALSIQSKIPEFRLQIKWNGPFRWGPTKIFGTTFEGGWSTLNGPVILVGRTEMFLSVSQNSCPQNRSFVSCLQEQ